jgi:hypothetical protein
VSDIEYLELDKGLCTVPGHCEGRFLNKRKIDICGRFRKGRSYFFPSDNAIHNYNAYCNIDKETKTYHREVST